MKANNRDPLKLGDITKKPFFLVPKGYFQHFYQKLLDRIEAEEKTDEEFMEEVPILSSIPKKEVFQVPEGYFSTFKIPIEDDVNPLTKQARNWGLSSGKIRKLTPIACAISIAASIVLLVGVWWNPSAVTPSSDWEQIETAELVAIMEHEKVDEYTIAEILGEEGLKNINLDAIDFNIKLSKEDLSEITQSEYELFDLELEINDEELNF